MLLPDSQLFEDVQSHTEGNALCQFTHSSSLAYATQRSDFFIEFFVREIAPVKLSGIVDVDESFSRGVPCNRRQPGGQKIWIVGLVQRTTNYIMIKLFPVDKRSAEKTFANNCQ